MFVGMDFSVSEVLLLVGSLHIVRVVAVGEGGTSTLEVLTVVVDVVKVVAVGVHAQNVLSECTKGCFREC